MDYINKIFSLEGKIAIITGGNGQLGTQYAEALAKSGARVAVFDIGDSLNDRLKKLNGEGLNIVFFKVDITDKENIKKGLENLKEKWGSPEILVNNAALDSPPGMNPDENCSFENYSLKTWESVLRVNLTGVFLCCQIIGEEMSKQKRGSIINISSTYGVVSPNQDIYKYRAERGKPFVKPVSYSAAKSAIINLTRYLATYWAKDGVRVNTLVPGGVFNNQDKEFLENYQKLTPIGRMAREDEYNGAILFLSSNASSYMTGSTLTIDGGWTAW